MARRTSSRLRFPCRRFSQGQEFARTFGVHNHSPRTTSRRKTRRRRTSRRGSPHPHDQGFGTLKQFYSTTFRFVLTRSGRLARGTFTNASFIFFLTFAAKNLIKGTQPRSLMSGANLDVKGESIDDERNEEESACEEKGCSEEKEVVQAGSTSSSSIHSAPSNRGRFYLGPTFLRG